MQDARGAAWRVGPLDRGGGGSGLCHDWTSLLCVRMSDHEGSRVCRWSSRVRRRQAEAGALLGGLEPDRVGAPDRLCLVLLRHARAKGSRTQVEGAQTLSPAGLLIHSRETEHVRRCLVHQRRRWTLELVRKRGPDQVLRGFPSLESLWTPLDLELSWCGSRSRSRIRIHKDRHGF